MRNRTYGGVRGRRTKVGRKLLRFPPTRFAFSRVAEVAERTGSTADVAGPRPREVGGACRIQVLAAARTQETVGGPNGAKRSEFRRCCPPVGVTWGKRLVLSNVRVAVQIGWQVIGFKRREQNHPFCIRHRIHVCKSGIFAPVVLQIDHHGGESWVFAHVAETTCANARLLPPPCAAPARLPSPAITCWRIRRFRGGVPDRRRDLGQSGASCQSAC